MKKNILLGAILPPIFVFLCYLSILSIPFIQTAWTTSGYWHSPDLIQDLRYIAKLISNMFLVILVVTAIPAIIYSMVMHFLVFPRIKSQQFGIGISTLIATLTALVPLKFLLGNFNILQKSTQEIVFSLYILMFATLSGACIGWILMRRYKKINPSSNAAVKT